MKKRDEEDTHIKYEYLIWKSGVGFMHTDNFSDDKLGVFLDDLKQLVEKRTADKDENETTIIPMDE